MIFQYVLSPDSPPPNRSRESLSKKSCHDFCVRNDHKQSSDEPGIQPQVSSRVQTNNEAALIADDQVGNDLPESMLPSRTTMPNTASQGLLVVRERGALGFDWLRPDCNHRPTYSGWRVLQTCRRIYLDAENFLARNREFVVFEGRKPIDGYAFVEIARLVRDNHIQPQFQRISSIHMYTQMYRLVSGWTRPLPLESPFYYSMHKSLLLHAYSLSSTWLYVASVSHCYFGSSPTSPTSFYNEAQVLSMDEAEVALTARARSKQSPTLSLLGHRGPFQAFLATMREPLISIGTYDPCSQAVEAPPIRSGGCCTTSRLSTSPSVAPTGTDGRTTKHCPSTRTEGTRQLQTSSK